MRTHKMRIRMSRPSNPMFDSLDPCAATQYLVAPRARRKRITEDSPRRHRATAANLFVSLHPCARLSLPPQRIRGGSCGTRREFEHVSASGAPLDAKARQPDGSSSVWADRSLPSFQVIPFRPQSVAPSSTAGPRIACAFARFVRLRLHLGWPLRVGGQPPPPSLTATLRQYAD